MADADDTQAWLRENTGSTLRTLLVAAAQEKPQDFKAWLRRRLVADEAAETQTMEKGETFTAKDKSFQIGEEQGVKGKVVLVTGASSGIGYLAAQLLGAKGMKVVMTARRVAKLEAGVAEIKAAGGEAMAVKLDVSKDEDHRAAFEAAEKAYGGVDFVIANAGYEGDWGTPFAQKSYDDDIKKVLETNVGGLILTAKHGIPAMQKRGGGVFITVSSVGAVVNRGHVENGWAMGKDMSSIGVYAASKSAADAFGRFMHHYLIEGIRHYTVNPCAFQTEMVTKGTAAFGMGSGKSTEYHGSTEGIDTAGGDMLGQAFNAVDKSGGGDPADVAKLFLTLLDNTTLYPPSSGILIDHDLTMNMKVLYASIEEPTPGTGLPNPAELLPLARDLRGYKR